MVRRFCHTISFLLSVSRPLRTTGQRHNKKLTGQPTSPFFEDKLIDASFPFGYNGERPNAPIV